MYSCGECTSGCRKKFLARLWTWNEHYTWYQDQVLVSPSIKINSLKSNRCEYNRDIQRSTLLTILLEVKENILVRSLCTCRVKRNVGIEPTLASRGHCRNRTGDLLHAKQTRYQLRQTPDLHATQCSGHLDPLGTEVFLESYILYSTTTVAGLNHIYSTS